MAIGSGGRGSGGIVDTIKIILQALAIALVVRVFFYQPFNIPSGSMKSTLLVGDYLFVSKTAYGYSRYSFPWSPNLFSGRVWSAEPKRGDVVVFKYPPDNSTDYIKRVIGLPGDEINVRGGIVFINGQEIKRVPDGTFDTVNKHGEPMRIDKYRETLPNGVSYAVLDMFPSGHYDDVGPYKVPEGHYFMMGDNRDDSKDSRARLGVGFVPFQNLVGRADIIFFSGAVDEPDAFRVMAPWTWPSDIRWGRFFQVVR